MAGRGRAGGRCRPCGDGVGGTKYFERRPQPRDAESAARRRAGARVESVGQHQQPLGPDQLAELPDLARRVPRGRGARRPGTGPGPAGRGRGRADPRGQLLALLEARLARARELFSRQLVSNYEQARPDLVSVVLESNGFNALLDKITYLRDAQQQQQTIIHVTRRRRREANAAAVRLAWLARASARSRPATSQRVLALASMNMLLHSGRARSRRRGAPSRAPWRRAGEGAALPAEISQVEAEQAAAERAAQRAVRGPAAAVAAASGSAGGSAGGSGARRRSDRATDPPVAGRSRTRSCLCESGGQNLTPEQRRRVGLLPDHARAPGDCSAATGPAAYLASKSEQDAVASADLERRRRRVQLGLRRDRRDPLTGRPRKG